MDIKNYYFILFSLPFFISVGFGQNITRLDKTEITAIDLDKKIEMLMTNANVQGLAVTIFNNNKPVYQKSFWI